MIPENTKRRLVLLRRLLETYSEEYITSQKIEEWTHWNSASIRKDFTYIQIQRGATKGYSVKELMASLKELIDPHNEPKNCCIIGLGRIGQSLFNSSDIYETPFNIVAGFDSSVNKTEVLRSSFPLHPTTLMKKIIKEENISYAILTVNKEESQTITDMLVECGIKGIINYTTSILKVPENIPVENVNLLTALENLCIMNTKD